jgi:hypothetical protein
MMRSAIVILVSILSANPILAMTQYACAAWEPVIEPENPALNWVKKSKPFVLIKDNKKLHLFNNNNEPITLLWTGFHNEILDLYQHIDLYNSKSIYYFRHSDYDDENATIDADPKTVKITRAALRPDWMIESVCFKR